MRNQAIIEINSGILSIGPLGTNFNEILIKMQNFSFHELSYENVVCEMAAIKMGTVHFHTIQHITGARDM